MRKIKEKTNSWRKNIVNIVIVSIAILGIISLGIIAAKSVISPRSKIFPAENKKTEMRKLPPEIKKEIQRASPSATFKVPILMYHYIEYVTDKRDTIRKSLNINPDIFEAQVQTLIGAGYTFITAKELGEAIDNKRTIPKKAIILTFDDGHWDLDSVILPILRRYNIKATAYIVPGLLGGSDFLTEKELRNVIDSGLIDVGAHTVHHVSLRDRTFKAAQYEIDQSKTMLEENYHIHVVSFAYPYGTFDKQAINIIKDAGFTTAASTIPGIIQSKQNRFFLYRIRPGYRIGKALLDYLSGNSFRAY